MNYFGLLKSKDTFVDFYYSSNFAMIVYSSSKNYFDKNCKTCRIV